MQRRTLNTSLSMSRIVYGMWRVADDPDTSGERVIAKIEACLAQGITTLDQADIYGDYGAEAVLGRALKARPDLRDKVEIVTKCGIVAPVGRHSAARVKHYDTSGPHIQHAVEQSLAAMHTDYIDLLLIHRPDPLMDAEATGRVLDDLVDSGKVRNIGVSNFRPWDWQLLQSTMRTALATNQIELSLQAHQALTNGDLAFHQQHGHAIMAWSPLAGGALMQSGHPVYPAIKRIADQHAVEPALIAVAWLLAHPADIVPILGTNNLERIALLGQALELEIDRQTWFELYTAAIGREVA